MLTADQKTNTPNNIDCGTLAMLSIAEFLPDDKIWDLGCGYGVVGILAAKLIGQENIMMCDSSEAAVKQAKINAFKKSVLGGKLIMVTKRLTWYKNKLTSIIGGVMIYEINGYHVFVAEKRHNMIIKKKKNVHGLSKKLHRKQRL